MSNNLVRLYKWSDEVIKEAMEQNTNHDVETEEELKELFKILGNQLNNRSPVRNPIYLSQERNWVLEKWKLLLAGNGDDDLYAASCENQRRILIDKAIECLKAWFNLMRIEDKLGLDAQGAGLINDITVKVASLKDLEHQTIDQYIKQRKKLRSQQVFNLFD